MPSEEVSRRGDRLPGEREKAWGWPHVAAKSCFARTVSEEWLVKARWRVSRGETKAASVYSSLRKQPGERDVEGTKGAWDEGVFILG